MRPPSREALFTSLVAGQLAGLAMLASIMAAYVLALDGTLLFPLQIMTALTAGEAALREVSMSTVLPGLLAHQLGLSILWSRVFGMIAGYVERTRLWWALPLGLGVGVVAELTDVYLLMPHFQKQVNGRNLWAEHIPLFWDWLAHLIYGVSLGYFYWRFRARRRAAM